MLGMLGKRSGKGRKAVVVRYTCQGCGREIVTFTEQKKVEIKECLRCQIKRATKKQRSA